MGKKHHKPEETVAKHRQVEILTDQGRSIAEAVSSIEVSEQTYFRWRAEYGGITTDQLKRLQELEVGNTRPRRAISDLTLDELILKEAAQETFEPRPPPRVRGDGVGHSGRFGTPGVTGSGAAPLHAAQGAAHAR